MKKELYQPISYTNIKCDGVKFSPSNLQTFRRNPKEWLEDTEKGFSFKGNKNTVQGTCVHYIFEQYYIAAMNDVLYSLDKYQIIEIIQEYISQEQIKNTITEEEQLTILTTIAQAFPVIEGFILEDLEQYETIDVESQVIKQIKLKNVNLSKSYYLGGTYDALVQKDEKRYLRDIKTSKRKVSSLDSYLIQLLSYEYLLDNIDYLQVVNVNLLKTKTNISYITSSVTEEMRLAFKEYIRELMITYDLSVKQPRLKNILFRKGTDFAGKIII